LSGDQLCRFQLGRLDLSPAFVWDPLQEEWDEQLKALGDFVEKRKTLPRLTYLDLDQFALARWLGRPRAALRAGTMSEERRGRLTGLLAHAEKLKSEHPRT
jgi:hypothetical protein